MFRSVLALFAVLLVCTGAWAQNPVVLGAYLSMTGNIAAYGQMGWDGISLAKMMEPEVLGRPVEVKLVDTKSDKVESANAVSRLIEKDKVAALLGEMTSSNTLAGCEISERRKIPSVTPTATNPLVTQNKTFVFRVCFTDEDQGKIGAKIAAERFKAKKVVVISDISQDYSVGLASFFKRAFTQAGGKIVGEAKFKSGDRDFTPQLSTIKEAKPDLIYAPIYYTEAALIAKQAREMGLDTQILAGDGVQAKELLELGGKAVEGLYFTTHFHPDMVTSERGKKFLELAAKELNAPPDAFTAMGADGYFIILDAIRRAGSDDPQKIRDALVNTKDFEGISGKIIMKANGDPIKSMVLDKVENNKFTYVATIEPDPNQK